MQWRGAPLGDSDCPAEVSSDSEADIDNQCNSSAIRSVIERIVSDPQFLNTSRPNPKLADSTSLADAVSPAGLTEADESSRDEAVFAQQVGSLSQQALADTRDNDTADAELVGVLGSLANRSQHRSHRRQNSGSEVQRFSHRRQNSGSEVPRFSHKRANSGTDAQSEAELAELFSRRQSWASLDRSLRQASEHPLESSRNNSSSELRSPTFNDSDEVIKCVSSDVGRTISSELDEGQCSSHPCSSHPSQTVLGSPTSEGSGSVTVSEVPMERATIATPRRLAKHVRINSQVSLHAREDDDQGRFAETREDDDASSEKSKPDRETSTDEHSACDVEKDSMPEEMNSSHRVDPPTFSADTDEASDQAKPESNAADTGEAAAFPTNYDDPSGNKNGSDSQHEDARDLVEGPTVLLQGTLWKKRSKLSKVSKLYRLVRREMAAVGQGEDVLSSLGKFQNINFMDTIRGCWSLIRGDKSLNADGKADEVDAWDLCHVRLLKAGDLMVLAWSKLPDDEKGLEDPSLIANSIGPLHGSSIEYMGMHHEAGKHVFRLFPVPQVRRHPLVFAAADAEEAASWITNLREACAFRLPHPAKPRSSTWDYFKDLYNGVGPPPECEPPCAVLRLEVVRTSSPSKDKGWCTNPYVLGHFLDQQFRTITHYDSKGDAHFAQVFNIPVHMEDPDAPVHFEVFSQPEYDDEDPVLFGGIAVPLFVFGRRNDLDLVLPLTQASERDRGVVNASIHHLVVRGYLDQPAGHLWLPVEGGALTAVAEPVTNQSQLNMGALTKQVNRIVALVELVVCWVSNIAFVLQWENFWFSLCWFVFMETWMLFLYRYTITIIALFLLRATIKLKPKRDEGGLFEEILQTEPLPSLVTPLTERHRAESMHVAPEAGVSPMPKKNQNDTRTSPNRSGDATPDSVIWEHERRLVFGGFSSSYLLLEGVDPPQWTDDRGWQCPGAVAVKIEDGVPYSYRWKVVVDENTDENGWQYAGYHFTDSRWCRAFDSMHTWVRVRQRQGWRVRRLDEGTNVEADSSATAAREAAPQRQQSRQHQVEAMITEGDLYGRHKFLYLSVTNVIDFWLIILEKHKNLLTWRDETVTTIILLLLLIILLLSLILPYSLVFAGIVALSFKIGALMGRRHRENRAVFLKSLSEWVTTRSRKQISLKGEDRVNVVDECGITRLDLRDWCNSTYRIQLDLRTVDSCSSLRDLAVLVIEASSDPAFEEQKRYRAWHSDVYNNFLDHVPSDSTEMDAESYCYKTSAATSLPPTN